MLLSAAERDGAAAGISVVIPVRDGALHLAEAIASALSQQEVEEVIVVDDGSTDGTPDVARAIADTRLRYEWQAAQGAAAARNRGAALATAPILAFLDADDLWLPGKLARQREALAAGTGDLVFTQLEEFLSPELSAEEAASLRPHPGVLNGVSVVTMLLRLDDFRRVGPFDASLATGEFLHWYARAQELGLRSHVVPELLARRRIHGANHGRRHAADRPQYAAILRDMLARRRAGRA